MKRLRPNPAELQRSIETRIERVLGEVAPLLRMEHCRFELGRFVESSGELTVRITGTCPDCAGSPAMFATAIEAHVKQKVPEVRQVNLREDELL